MNRKKLLKIPINQEEFASLKEDSFVWFSSLISLFLIFLISLLILFSWRQLPPQIPLFFSRPWGEKQLSSPLGFWLLPIISFSIFIFNLLLSIVIFKKEILIRRILAATALITSSLCFLTTYKIIALIA